MTGDGLWDVLMRNPYYEGVHAPGHLLGYNHVLDDVPNSLVPISELGTALDVPTPTTHAIIDLACAVARIDFRAHRRTLQALGLDGLAPEEMLELVNTRRLVVRPGSEAWLGGSRGLRAPDAPRPWPAASVVTR